MTSPEPKNNASPVQEESAAAGGVPVIRVERWQALFDDRLQLDIAENLRSFLMSRRWYRDKTRVIRGSRIEAVIPMSSMQAYILGVRIDYEDGGRQFYLISFALGGAGEAKEDAFARVRSADGSEKWLYDAFRSDAFRKELFATIQGGTSLRGSGAELAGSQTSAFPATVGQLPESVATRLMNVEQSNTSVVYGDRCILKVFRKLEEGINPDIEIGAFLTEHGFRNTPAVAGWLEYIPAEGRPMQAAILQQFVPNKGDAWKYTLDSLGEFFREVQQKREAPPILRTTHPLEAIPLGRGTPDIEILRDYLASIRLLGERTAQMHAVLADVNAGPEFAPEPSTPESRREMYDALESQADASFQLLRQQHASLDPEVAEDADRVLAQERRIRERFRPLLDRDIQALRIRHHGDFHLGQVLYTGTDFMIIDFEGEPAVPLAARRSKQLALRDVAGMVRSFQYAPYAALLKKTAGAEAAADEMAALETWSTFWTTTVSAEYLRGYFGAAEGYPFVPATREERRRLLDIFLLQKALYEIGYELNNRPAWVRIPLRGILGLMD
jgi:maltose alpha-D-glucosyltransferase/alpha-amylase